jgi:L-ribulose-5-phosphate 4-epimerase
MMVKRLREEVLEANLELVRHGLVVDTFGNASGISRKDGLVAIKPSGVRYTEIKPSDLVVTDIDGRIVEGALRPSSDLPTHLALYRAFPEIGGVAHTHSRSATAWAQACREIPCLGTTHADYFRGPVPVTEPLTPEEIEKDYEWNTGQVIVRRFASSDAAAGRKIDPMQMRAVLVAGHAPFCWGATPAEAAHLAWMLEEVAQMAFAALTINPAAAGLPEVLRDKHFLRKHGPDAYYGQNSAKTKT